ncbi:MAG TPA: DUF4238 domain-containing protein [Phycisphaerae bacterium]|nr:DUF4238 domain-containing protein [Phycisphaerae bacterium]
MIGKANHTAPQRSLTAGRAFLDLQETGRFDIAGKAPDDDTHWRANDKMGRMGITKTHHYLPQFYLRGFAKKSNLAQTWCIEKTKEARHYPVSIEKAGAEKHFHTIELPGGERDSSTIEQELSKEETNQGATILRILRKEPPLTSDRVSISRFVSLMQYRVPSFKKAVENQIVSTAKIMLAMLAKGKRLEEMGEMYNIKIYKDIPEAARTPFFDKMRRRIEAGWVPKVTNAHLLQHMFAIAFSSRILSVLNGMRLTIWDAPDGFGLVTCDQPVALYQPQTSDKITPAGLADSITELTIPLSSNCLIKLDWSKEQAGRYTLDPAGVQEFNRRSVFMAVRNLYASEIDSNTVQLIQKNHKRFAGMKNDIVWKPDRDGAIHISSYMPVLPD